MNREAKQHLIYGGILVAITIAMVLTQNYQVSKTTRQLNNQQLQLEQSLTEKIDGLQQQINTEKEERLATDTSLGQNVKKLNNSIDSGIQGLEGKLAQVKIQSKEDFAKVEKSLSSLKTEFRDFSDVIEQSVPSVVSVQTDRGSGSGFVTSDSGHIVTNYHVIEGARAASVITQDGNSHAVRIVGFHKKADVAVLQIDNSNYQRLPFGDSDQAKVGQKVIAIGNPGGLDFTVTQGIVSAVDRSDASGNKYIQIDVPINPGNSGGPLINANGHVIGVNTLKIAGFEGVGFALSSNYIDDIVEDIIEN